MRDSIKNSRTLCQGSYPPGKMHILSSWPSKFSKTWVVAVFRPYLVSNSTQKAHTCHPPYPGSYSKWQSKWPWGPHHWLAGQGALEPHLEKSTLVLGPGKWGSGAHLSIRAAGDALFHPSGQQEEGLSFRSSSSLTGLDKRDHLVHLVRKKSLSSQDMVTLYLFFVNVNSPEYVPGADHRGPGTYCLPDRYGSFNPSNNSMR